MPNPPTPKPNPGKKVAGVDTKWWILGGGAAVAVVWYSYHKAKKTTATDPTATLDPSIDPATGIPYAQEYSTYDNTGYSTPSSGGAVGMMPSTTTLSGDTTQPQSLQAWLLEAETALVGMGYDPNLVAASLGAVAAGQPLNSTQQGVVATAGGAVGGAPPTTSGMGFAPTSPAPQPSAPAPAPVKLATMSAPSLHGEATTISPMHCARFQWNAVAGAKGYNIYYAGVYHMYHSDTSFTSAPHPRGFRYGPITVKAIRAADGKPGPSSNAVTVTIK